MRSSLLDDLILEVKEGLSFFERSFDWPLFLSARNARILINSRSLVLCAWCTTECGNFGIRKSMFTSFSIFLLMTWIVMVDNGSPHSFTKRFISHVEWFRFRDKNMFDNHLAHFLCLFQQRVSSFFHVSFQRGDLFCLHRTCLDFSHFNNGSHRSFTTSIWNLFVRLQTSRSLPNFWSLSTFWTQLSFSFVFQGDLWWRSRWHVHVLVPSQQLSEHNKLEVFLERWWCSIASDKTLILSFQ